MNSPAPSTRRATIKRAGGQYPRTRVARQHGPQGPGAPAPKGREKPSADRQITALSRKETRDHELHGASFRYTDSNLAAGRRPDRVADRDRRRDRRRRAL